VYLFFFYQIYIIQCKSGEVPHDGCVVESGDVVDFARFRVVSAYFPLSITYNKQHLPSKVRSLSQVLRSYLDGTGIEINESPKRSSRSPQS
jgi:hypothetical protein